MLECDTNTPGCERMCTNQFYPVLPTDYWALEMIFVSLPICIALTYIRYGTPLSLDKRATLEQIFEENTFI